MSRRRGFTLIELSVVIVILAMFAAAVVPNLARTVTSSQDRSYRQSLLTLVQKAHTEAIMRGQTVSLSVAESGALQIAVQQDDQQEVIRQVDANDGQEIAKFMLKGEEVADSDWIVQFYADGKCDGGGFQVGQGNAAFSYQIRRSDGRVRLNSGELDVNNDPESEWEAGQFEPSTSL